MAWKINTCYTEVLINNNGLFYWIFTYGVFLNFKQLNNIDGIICLGAVIKGATSHFHFIASEVTKGIAVTSLESGKPISFGIITSENIEQAIERAGTKSGNKGYDAAMSVIEMVSLIKDKTLCVEGKQES